MCTKLGALIPLWALIVASVIGGDCPADREQTLHDEGKLHQDLLCAYKSDYRPVKDHKTSIQVKVRFALKYISFDSLEETFTVHSWVAMTWKDEFLSWTPSNYGDIKEIQIESHEIWTPRMALFNADASLYQSDSIYTTCLVANDGVVTCVPHLAHSGICRISLRRWPYDVQNCTMYFGSWMHTGEQVNYTFYQKQPVVLDDYNNGPGWKLLNVANERLSGKYSCCPNSTYPMLKYTFLMKREAAGPAAIVVVPSIVIVMLTLTSLLLDVKDNIRLIIVCFSLFGHFIFLTEIGYNIPKHSADTPIILLFVRDSMIVTLVTILETLLLMSLRRRTLPAPTWIVTVTRLVTSGPGKYVVFTEFDPSDLSDNKNILTEDGSSKEERARAASDWIQFANLLNSCIFIVSVFVYLVLIFAYIPYDN
ncbi:neuronal acetylcholine receptor subunit alpha-5-like [Pectinophora gossypiella]|uniref:neuronal acetylcholine receptor subunit alpha-5-like n=1 Tax=Pectinophora gossypiella TaxID=13191 RepID=UPI00214F439A|nr:neuronal acetylcholine receptor subunit alpha-5-like [Pectinophora gossypiella]